MIRCAPWISWGTGGEALVLFDERDGSYHALNTSASLIWRFLSDGLQGPEILAALVASHTVEPAAAAGDVASFIESAVAKGLLVDESAERKPAVKKSS